MVSSTTLSAAILLAVSATCVPQVDAHGYVAKPPVEFNKGTQYPSQWVKEFPPPWSGTFKTGAQYAAAAKAKGFKNLRAFLEDKGPVCGNTNPKATPRAIPSDKKVVFSRAIVHPGPCEIWLDNTLVYHNDDCEKTFGSSTPVFPVDWSSCKGDCLLRFYWLGLQDSGHRWQSYKNCVPVTSSKSRSIDDDDDNDEPSEPTFAETETYYEEEDDAREGINTVDADEFNASFGNDADRLYEETQEPVGDDDETPEPVADTEHTYDDNEFPTNTTSYSFTD